MLERPALAATLALVLGHYLWTVTSNGRPLQFGAGSGEYYNRLADALLDGRLSLRPDPDPAVLALANPYGPENQPHRIANLTQDLSLFRGRYYLYFGVAPAVTLFVPFRLLTGHALPQPLAAALLLFGAVALSAATFVALRRRLQPGAPFLLRWLPLLALGFGNFGPFVLRRPVVYEVATTAASFFQAAALFALVRTALAERVSPPLLAVASAAAALAVGSRPTQAPLLALLVAAGWWLRARPGWGRPALACLAAPAALGLAGLAAYNHARFGSPFEFGLQYELSDWDIRQIRLFSPSYLWFNLVGNVLALPRIDPEFPFVHATPALPPEPPAGYMMVETRTGLFGGMPLAAMALAWPFLLRRAPPERRLASAVATALGATGLVLALGVCLFAASSIRFTLDFSMPVLVAAGLAWVSLHGAFQGRWARWSLAAAGAAAVAWGVGANLALGLTGLYDWLRRGEPTTYDRLEAAAAPLQKAALGLHRRHYGPARLTFRLGPAPPGGSEVLLAANGLFRHDALCLRYLENGRVALRFEQRGFAPIRSRALAVSREQEHTVEVAMGSLYPVNRRALARLYPALAARGVDRELRVLFDGTEVLAGRFDFVASSPEAVLVGRDAWGNGSCNAPFGGRILNIERTFPP